MSDIEEEAAKRTHGRVYGGPYTANNPVPTIQNYREHRAELQERNQQSAHEVGKLEPRGKENLEPESQRTYEPAKTYVVDEGRRKDGNSPYPTVNRNLADQNQKSCPRPEGDAVKTDGHGQHANDNNPYERSHKHGASKHTAERSATEQAASALTPKEQRKAMKKTERHGAGREVTDPVTHLPITIHDMTDQNLKTALGNEIAAGSTAKNSTGLKAATDNKEQVEKDKNELDRGHRGMRKLFPPPEREGLKRKLMGMYANALMVGLGTVGCVAVVAVVAVSTIQGRSARHKSWPEEGKTGRNGSLCTWISVVIVLSSTAATMWFLLTQISGWLEKRVDSVFNDETWDAAWQEDEEISKSNAEMPESVAWLNNLLASVWPMINPDLFASVADTLEDVMQASLPKVVRMVSVDDLGQGSESIRVLGVRWLPAGAAKHSVSSRRQSNEAPGDDGAAPGEGQGNDKLDDGMEAEEGDFVNMELAFAYRAQASGKSIKSKARNAHLYLKFYLPGGIAMPVWVEVRGIIGIMRLRLQLTPDPPFFSLCTLTFLGQPRADISCVPLSRHNLNIMDVPLISNFVQSSIDAALASYVAPKSLSLDLKEMLMGDDFKKDTVSRGVILVHIKRAKGFKQGDGGIGPLAGSSDSYVAVSWGKFGKPVASTRIITDSQEPNWNEWASILVTPEEIDAEETLRVQIWDSDKHTADDDLGRVEIPLSELTHGSQRKNRMCNREDSLRGDDLDRTMPGTLFWSIGYFAKTRIQQDQLDNQAVDPDIRSTEKLERQVFQTASSKLRESASGNGESDELRQQTIQDFKEKEDEMLISAPPPKDFPSGILSIQIHNITELEISELNKREREDDAEEDGNLPDSYCTIILNHKKVYRTRTKPKNANPFFNAGTERFVPDWRTTEVIVSIRDNRSHENNPLLGVLYLPLRRVFEQRSQVMESFPIAGGIGSGRARISMVWRSVEYRLPKEMMGWDYGTLEVLSPIMMQGAADEKIKHCKIYLKTKIAQAKMKSPSNDGTWRPKQKGHESVRLAVVDRYRTPLVLEFRQSSVAIDTTLGLAVVWLHEIPDEEERKVVLKVWKAGKDQLQRAHGCADYKGLEEGEEPLGEIEMRLKFWRGLSGYHHNYAGKSYNGQVREVMEVLDTVNGENLTADDEEGESSDAEDSDSGSKSCSSGEPHKSRPDADIQKRPRNAVTESGSSESGSGGNSLPSRLKKRALHGDHPGEDDGSRGMMDQIRDYKANHKRLHRKHRGIMQWKTTRTLDWMADKVGVGKGKIGEAFKHSDKDVGIETEV